MINLSYHLSEEIKENLSIVDKLRTQILTTPLKPRTENLLKYQSDIEKAYWGLTLAKNPITKTQAYKLMSKPLPKKLNDYQKEVVSYIETLRLIREYWTASKSQISSKNILEIYNISCKSVFGSTSTYFRSKESEVADILKFIESGNDHPVIQAGLLQIEITKLSPFENGTGRVAKLLSHLMFSKHGYDLRGLLILEDYYRSDLVSLKEALESIEKDKNATFWLEYFTEGVKKSYQNTLKLVTDPTKSKFSPNFYKLSDRQKSIMEKMNNPEVKISNKEVCKMFKISQITASRDLSKMVNLGLLLPHNKGRSTFYTKA
ncbi:MAG: hypothetical protein QY322_04275 [bacterium]|nr:MAG: hypothetical protein QY322_04275 [bacterium]